MLFQAMNRRIFDSASDNQPSEDDEDGWVGDGSDFRIRRLRLQRGQNLITWTVANNRDLTTLGDIIHVPKIDIFGLAFTPSCTKCPPGTYSSTGAKKCKSCAPNSYSHSGASTCSACTALEYSGSKANRCLRRVRCESLDYYPVVREAKCENGSTKTTENIRYARIEPAVCVESLGGYLGDERERSDNEKVNWSRD